MQLPNCLCVFSEGVDLDRSAKLNYSALQEVSSSSKYPE